MKKMAILLLALVSTLALSAQINGDKNIITQTFPLEEIKTLKVNIGAEIIIDMNGKSEISITTDANIIPYLSRKVTLGKLDFDQKEWIESSSGIKVVIGAPALRKLILDSHGNIIVRNMKMDKFSLEMNVGKLQLIGTVGDLFIKNDLGDIDASELIAENADIQITNWGKVTAQVTNRLKTSVADNGRIIIVNTPKELAGDANNALTRSEVRKIENRNIRFIRFDLKNNSMTRKHYEVVGPKPDGSTFSYGFPMNPGQIRKKDWTNGSEVYETNAFGKRKKLVLTIKLEDEGQVVTIY